MSDLESDVKIDIEDDEQSENEEENIDIVIEQIRIEDEMDKLHREITNYTYDKCVAIGDKLSVFHLINLLYPEMKRVY